MRRAPVPGTLSGQLEVIGADGHDLNVGLHVLRAGEARGERDRRTGDWDSHEPGGAATDIAAVAHPIARASCSLAARSCASVTWA